MEEMGEMLFKTIWMWVEAMVVMVQMEDLELESSLKVPIIL